MLTVRDANRRLDLNLPEGSGYTTLAGFLLAQSGRLLKEGEIVEYEARKFKVELVEKRRIRRIRLTAPTGTDQMSAVTLLSFASTSVIEPLQMIPMFI